MGFREIPQATYFHSQNEWHRIVEIARVETLQFYRDNRIFDVWRCNAGNAELAAISGDKRRKNSGYNPKHLRVPKSKTRRFFFRII